MSIKITSPKNSEQLILENPLKIEGRRLSSISDKNHAKAETLSGQRF